MPANDRVRRQRYTEVNSTGALARAEREASRLRPSNLIQVMLAKGAHCGCGRHRGRRRRDRHRHRLAGGPLRAGRDADRPRRRRPAGRRQGEPGRGGHARPGLRVGLRRAGPAQPQPARHRPLPELQPRAGRGERQGTGLRTEGTLAVAYDSGDLAALDRLTDFRHSIGLKAERLDGRECRRLEPFLAPGTRGGVLATGDLSVDNRRYLAALRVAAAASGVRTLARHRDGGRRRPGAW